MEQMESARRDFRILWNETLAKKALSLLKTVTQREIVAAEEVAWTAYLAGLRKSQSCARR